VRGLLLAALVAAGTAAPAWAAAAPAATPATPGVPVASDAALRAFKAAPVGQRLAALGHEPLVAVPMGNEEVAVVVYAPFQSAISRWDDESRVVLYRRGAADYERVQFVSRAAESIPGRIAVLLARDVDGDGVVDLVGIGRAHGPVGKATLMIFRRREAGGRFDVVFRRRQAAPALVFAPGGRLTYTYETPRRVRRFEAFVFSDGLFRAPDGGAAAIVLD
jgi:hypothetical protein